ncbi:E2/UBC family protein [Reichenbachiella sp. MALMAid0571]|uniref:E2/UBC family protein n=1 Tax=Reichenbachiella sp. MALMAid0571 TaxID=3143939 RepID=UPI0032DF1CFA
MRRQFALPEEDLDYLTAANLKWETIIEGPHRWLLIHEYPVKDGYNIDSTTAALRIDQGYPNSQIDMVYFFPSISRIDGKPIGALANQSLDGKTYQRWSRHRTGQNPWRPGVDNLETHLMQVDYWMEREFQIR